MEQNNRQEFELEQEPVKRQGSGSLLAAARKRQNRTVEEIAEELNLSVTQIKTIELDQTEGLPEPTYVRGYIRSYSRLLGLDADEVLSHYLNPNWQQSTNFDEMPRGIGSAEESSGDGIFTPARVIGTIAVLGSLALLWYSGMLSGLFSSAEPDNNEIITVPSESAPDTATVFDDAPEAVGSPDTSGSLVEETAVVNNELLLEFSQTSWVDIRDGEDNRLAYRSYAKDERLRVAAPGLMSVFIGNADGVTVTYNGAAFDLSRYREGVYAKFTVGDE